MKTSSLKHEDDLKNEDNLKNKDDLKNDDNLKNEDDLKKIRQPWPTHQIFLDDITQKMKTKEEDITQKKDHLPQVYDCSLQPDWL